MVRRGMPEWTGSNVSNTSSYAGIGLKGGTQRRAGSLREAVPSGSKEDDNLAGYPSGGSGAPAEEKEKEEK